MFSSEVVACAGVDRLETALSILLKGAPWNTTYMLAKTYAVADAILVGRGTLEQTVGAHACAATVRPACRRVLHNGCIGTCTTIMAQLRNN